MQTQLPIAPAVTTFPSDARLSGVARLEQQLSAHFARLLPLDFVWKTKLLSWGRFLAGSPLEVGLGARVSIRREKFESRKACPTLRGVYLSDLHLHPLWGARLVQQLLHALQDIEADFYLLGGDLVEAEEELPRLSALVQDLAGRGKVYAVPGNHDAALGGAALASAVRAGGGTWLEDCSVTLGPGVELFGYIPAKVDPQCFSILLTHDPQVFPLAVRAGLNLVLAGHIHGAQVHLWRWRGRSYPGAFAYRWNGTRFRHGSSELLVSRGLVDFLPVRWRCPREIVYFEF